MSMRGHPDWGRPTRVGDTPGWAAFEEPGVVLVPYAAVTAAPVLPTAGVTVDLFTQDRHDAGIVAFGLVTAGFALHHRVPGEVGDLRARLAPSGRGLVALTAPADLHLAEERLTTEEFLPASGRTLTTTLRLGGVEAEILVAALQRDLQALGAVVWIEVPGVAERAPGTLTVDVPRFLVDVRAARPDGVLTRDEVAALVEGGSPAVRLTTTSDATDAAAARALTGAVVDRIVGLLGTFVPPPDPGTAGAWAFPQPGAESTSTFDLARPLLAPRSVRLATDPVIDGTATGTAAVDVRRHDATGLPDGRHRVVVRATVPDSPVGVLDVGVDLLAAPRPPDRPFSVQAGVRLADVWASPTRTAEVELALGPTEPLAYTLRATSLLPTTSGLVPVEGPPRSVVDDSSPVVTPDDLALRFLPVQATASLLDRAEVAVTLTADGADGATYEATARLDAAGSVPHLALPTSAAAPTLVAVAVDHTTRRGTQPLSLPLGGVLLDLFSFPDAPWSDGAGATRPPEPTMTSFDTAGLRLTPRSATAWEFAPLTAGVARTAEGTPQLTVLSAGGQGHLAVTTTLLASDHQLTEARDALASRLGGPDPAPTLAPADVAARSVSLQLRGSDGTWTDLAAGRPSGTFLQECTFSVALDAHQLEAVRRATSGEQDLLRVTYALLGRGGTATSTSGGTTSTTSSSTTTSSTTSSTTSTVTTTRSSSGSPPATSTTAHHDEESTTAATTAAHPETAWTVTSDASSWDAGPPA
ncbi:hypothetical protein [Marmoricola sp. Leaf446]|uniref:hypothetical protein n=1 Tax=Marmoricola sp. Leaf446 TaxID=1736379 RepID=UPI000ACFF63E|nr:hypothetical protein [Marmoricola sp. Leaf446]